MPMDRKEEVITHRLTPKSGCFREIGDLLIVLQSIAMASEYLVSGAVQFAQGDYVTVEAQLCRQKVRLPLFGPVQAALVGRKADVIELSVVSGTAQERTYAHWTNGTDSVRELLKGWAITTVVNQFLAQLREKPDRSYVAPIVSVFDTGLERQSFDPFGKGSCLFRPELLSLHAAQLNARAHPRTAGQL